MIDLLVVPASSDFAAAEFEADCLCAPREASAAAATTASVGAAFMLALAVKA